MRPMKHAAVVVASLLLVASSAAATEPAAHITIRHQDAGCHAWSADGGPFRASLTVTIRRGQSVEFTNDDLMTHRLVEIAGPRLALPEAMVQSTFHHPGGGTVAVRFADPGTYRLRTVDGD